jgi:NAD(P)-dependent dehydrogenase (short-subunit alcohol dehydrogenase family)
MSGRLDGKVALITGAAAGIGAAVMELFAAEGAHVLGFDRDAHDGGVTGEVTDLPALQSAVAEAERRWGALHVVVGSAGVIGGGTAETVEEDEWRRIVDINLTGTYLTAKAAIPALRRAGGGSLVTVASAAGITAWTDQAAYDASKGGVVNLTRSMALDFAADGIRVNCLVPAFVATAMSRGFGSEDGKARMRALIPLGRFSEPREIAYGALFLASDESSFATGSTLVLDGGYLAR